VLDWSGSPNAEEGAYTSYKLVRWSAEDTIDLQSETSLEPPKPTALKKFRLRLTDSRWNVIGAP